MKRISFKPVKIRTCVATREKFSQEELIRMTYNKKQDKWILNLDNKVQGRSIYLRRDATAIEKFLKRKNYKGIKLFKINDNLRNELSDYAKDL